MIELLRDVEERRGVPLELLCSALEEALARGFAEHAGVDNALAVVDRMTGGFALFRRRVVVDHVRDGKREVAAGAGFEPGDFVDEPLDVTTFGRVAALTAKRVVAARVLEFERESVFDAYRTLEGHLVEGLVQRETSGDVVALLDERNEAVMPRGARSPLERYRINDRLRFELQAVKKTARGPALFLSRGSERFVRLLFDDPRLVAGARAAGRQTILAATSNVPRAAIDAVRAELGGEPVRIVPFDDDLCVLARAAFFPASVVISQWHDLGVTIAVSDDPIAWDLAPLVSALAGERIVPCAPADVAAFRETIEAERAAAPAIVQAHGDVDPAIREAVERWAEEIKKAPSEDEAEGGSEAA